MMCSTIIATLMAAWLGVQPGAPPPQALAAQLEDILRAQRTPSVTCTKTNQIIRLSSAEIADYAGFTYATVTEAPLRHSITRMAQLAYNGNRHARLPARAAGVITEIRVDLGEMVSAGDILAVIDSVDLGQSKANLLQWLELVKLRQRNLERKRTLVEGGVGIERELFEAETSFAEARIALDASRQKLRNLGLSGTQIEAVESDRETSSLLQVVAPFDGIVVERNGTIGEAVEPAQAIISIADTSTMWAMLDLNEHDLAVVSPGCRAIVTPDGLRARSFAGRLTWISTEVDPRTRMIKARVVIPNDDGILRANMFARAEIVTHDGEPALLVPRSAVQWEGCCNVVFVRDDVDASVFRPRKVLLGYETDGHYEVLDGLDAGTLVVTDGSFILKTELVKSSIGAGCCEVEHLAE